MKKSILYFLTAIMLIVVSCSESYDDSALVGRVDDLENRVAKLEELCKQMNTNISSLQALVNALENKDYVTGVTPITQNGETVGYTINFTKSQPITIYHGQDGANGADGADGKDGYTPVIGVKKDADGIYYWTLDGEWLLDADGNKIKAQGTDGKNGADGKDGENGKDGVDGEDGKDGEDGEDGQDGVNGTDGKNGEDGKDGITPQLKIEDDYWFVSYDNGASWTQLGKATGEDGKDGTNGTDGTNGANGIDGVDGDSFFQDVDTTNSDYVIFTLADGTELAIPRFKNLSISFDIADGAACLPSASIKVGYTLSGADSGTTIETIGENGWKSAITKTSISNGYITITAPEHGGDGKVVMLATTSIGFSAMKVLTIEEGVFLCSNDVYEVGAEASTLKVKIQTNLDYSISISSNATSWISVADTRAEMRTDTITFNIAAMPQTISSRTATITLFGKCGDKLQNFTIWQTLNVWRVRTVVGDVYDLYESSKFTDGPFGNCGNIFNPATFTADPLNPLHIYMSTFGETGGPSANDYPTTVRLIDFEKQEVHTILTKSRYSGSSMTRIRDVKFTNDADANMLVAWDGDFTTNADTPPTIELIKRKKDTNGKPIIGQDAFKNQPSECLVHLSHNTCNGMAVHPKTGSIYFSDYLSGSFYKFPDHTIYPGDNIYSCLDTPYYDDKHRPQQMFSASTTSFEARCEIHPDGDYMLIPQINGNTYIAKSMYNPTNDTFDPMFSYIGKHSTEGGSRGYVDAVLGEAKTNAPWQIAWVKNQAYAGQEDEYDAYFTDRNNHCIRKITPEGYVSTFAGRGFNSAANDIYGHIDGWARAEALFDYPCALIYNEERNVFWVGDCYNTCIREIYLP